jgi:hypothetical protein
MFINTDDGYIGLSTESCAVGLALITQETFFML